MRFIKRKKCYKIIFFFFINVKAIFKKNYKKYRFLSAYKSESI